jgi:hypothetical protein
MEDHAKTDAKQPVGLQARPEDREGAEINIEKLTELRERKNLEYLRSVLRMENPLAAGVGVLNGDLMIFANHMQRIIIPALRTLPTEPGALAKVMPAVEAYSRVARQVERLAILTDRLNRQQEAASKAAATILTKEAVSGTAST